MKINKSETDFISGNQWSPLFKSNVTPKYLIFFKKLLLEGGRSYCLVCLGVILAFLKRPFFPS